MCLTLTLIAIFNFAISPYILETKNLIDVSWFLIMMINQACMHLVRIFYQLLLYRQSYLSEAREGDSAWTRSVEYFNL
jgi:hypothetical protein